MTFKVTVWNKDQSFGHVRDYRKSVWGNKEYTNCHGMTKVMEGGQRVRPWVIELEGEVPKDTLYKWAVCTLHPHSERSENILVNGKTLGELDG
jgi:hypothetical protein